MGRIGIAGFQHLVADFRQSTIFSSAAASPNPNNLPLFQARLAEVDALTARLLDAECFIGEGYFGRIFSFLATELSAEELLGWFVRQKYRWPRALGAAIAGYAARGQIKDACRVALAFPYLEAARKLFRQSNSDALEYYTELLEKEFEPGNALYALAYCCLEGGDDRAALDLFEAALGKAEAEPRRQDIEARLAEIRARLAA